MTFLSLEPFIPSGNDFKKSKELFRELGFEMQWEDAGLAGFRNGNCRFILQQYDNRQFAENLMISVKISGAAEFYESAIQKKLSDKFGIPPIGPPVVQPYGKEVNVIDIAGVCWHFIEP